MFVLILWSALVSQLVSTTSVYQKCKASDCVVKVKDVGYKIELKDEQHK